jgi:tRNA G10  N-methylase Trm11
MEQGIYLGDQEQLFNNITSNSIDAIITDPPYGLKWDHKIETHFNFENFINNAYRVIKDNGFLVYFPFTTFKGKELKLR